MAGIAYQPQTETMAQIHGIRNITLGAIATASVLVSLQVLALEYMNMTDSVSGSLGVVK